MNFIPQLQQSYLPSRITCEKMDGYQGPSIGPLWPPEPDAGQGTFPLITLALSSTFLQKQPPNTVPPDTGSKWDMPKPSPFSLSLVKLVFGAIYHYHHPPPLWAAM